MEICSLILEALRVGGFLIDHMREGLVEGFIFVSALVTTLVHAA